VKKRILLVQKEQETRVELQKVIGSRYDLFAVSEAEEAIEACRTVGPFAVAMVEHGAQGGSAFDLLRRVNDSWPETIGLLITPEIDVSTWERAAKEPQVFRCVTLPCTPGALLSALEAAFAKHVEVDVAESVSEQLQFSRDSMEGFTTLLEERVERQVSAIDRLQRFTKDLSAARSAAEIAHLAASTASEILSGRGVLVQLWRADASGEDVEAGAGREMSSQIFRTPISTGECEVGEIAIDLVGPNEARLSPVDGALVASIAGSAAVAVRHELSRRHLDRSQHATILALAKLAERRDTGTGQHLERVAAYCRIVAQGLRAMGKHGDVLTDAYIDDLVCASPLHDVGKVGVPDSILLKPGQLTPEEWVVMKTHAEVGGTTIESVIRGFGAPSFLVMGRDIAWSHHEKWDGTGYPRGLRESAIPLCARIVAIADVYDALTTLRPYKRIWPHTEAVDWIASRAGSHFDPDVVTAFLSRADAIDRIRGDLADPQPLEEESVLELEPA